jgi:hypothetical protein
MDITTPAQVISELNRLMNSSSAGINALFEQEVKVAQLDQQYERDLSLGLLNAGSDLPDEQSKKLTSPEKVAISKLKASEAKLALDIGKAELNRIKSKLKAIDSAIMATGMIGKQVELQWRNA